jgi:hypothetical protein
MKWYHKVDLHGPLWSKRQRKICSQSRAVAAIAAMLARIESMELVKTAHVLTHAFLRRSRNNVVRRLMTVKRCCQ